MGNQKVKSMEKNIVDKAMKYEDGWKNFTLRATRSAISSCDKKFLARQKNSVKKELFSLSLPSSLYGGKNSKPSKKHRGHFADAFYTSLKGQPEHDESSIFDSAWATLRGEPWQCSSDEFDDE
jgi:hypothetical protein